MDLFWNFQLVEGIVVGQSADVIIDLLFHLFSVECSAANFWVTVDKSDDVVLQRISIDPDLRDEIALNVNVFKFLGCDIFSLAQFEDVLCSIDDL